MQALLGWHLLFPCSHEFIRFSALEEIANSSLSSAGSNAVTAKAQWGEIKGCCEADKMPMSSDSAQGSAVASFSPAPCPFQLNPRELPALQPAAAHTSKIRVGSREEEQHIP